MEAWIESIARIGLAPSVAMFLLYDYSKKLASLQISLAVLVDGIARREEMTKDIITKLDGLDDLIKEKCKK